MGGAGESGRQWGEANAIPKQVNTRPKQVTTGHTKLQQGGAILQQGCGPDSAASQQIAILHFGRLLFYAIGGAYSGRFFHERASYFVVIGAHLCT